MSSKGGARAALPTRLKSRLREFLGPGLITGASDDDPSGIATYSQAGAQFGYGLGWTLVVTYPFMVAVQMISARIGRTTGHGIAGNLRRYYPRWLLNGVVALLLVANTINIGADLGAMADASRLVIGGPSIVYLVIFAAFCALTQVFMSYQHYVSVLKWLSTTLLAYVFTLLLVHVDWKQALVRLVIPHLSLSAAYVTTIVALFGTTISPYLFFWQASEEAEDVEEMPERDALTEHPEQGEAELERIEVDTLGGMAASNLVALAIVFATAATLHGAGITDIQSSAQAAEALRPIAGNQATIVFALGIVGTGLLAVPVLAGSAAYALGEAFGWPVGLARLPLQAKAFYGAIVAATAIGLMLNFTPINPIKALYWSAVLNGVVAVPVMAIMMLLTSREEVMGEFTVYGPLRWLGWLATALMGGAVLAMALTAS
jgi:Mn2+/Fe2+ NRAMP family transporter